MLLSYLAEVIGAELVGDDAQFSQVSTDSRSICPGDFFVALQGQNFDGHQYLEKAANAGAIGALVSVQSDLNIPQVVVADTRIGLGRLSQAWLDQFSPRKVAITGSCGKTTVKEMVASILSQVAPTLSTKGNFNNDIGVPLTLCRLKQEHKFAVIEMGANHVGEIGYVADLVKPHVALVNNVGTAHLEGFGSIENIARAKAEIYQSLAPNGVAVVNLDDDFAEFFMGQTKHCQRLTFSVDNPAADVRLLSASVNHSGQYRFDVAVQSDVVAFDLPLIGFHNVTNALAAIAMTHALGCTAEQMAAGLAVLRAVPGRLRLVGELTDLRVIDDTYNANPESMRSAIDVLASMENDTCLVLGAMAELGSDSDALHREVGAYAAQRGIKTIYGVGDQAALYKDGYLANSGAGAFVVADNHQALAEALLADQRNKTILIKGSRSSAMEKVIEHMIQCQEPKGSAN
ncbi:MAG: UDP-N-acetylmuramoyl-tripeptide--D-alanyl-D-alanine ligase [Ketobacter sp.]|nr:UDP-N-acetylmuramoyl-tripeptide--D-alanyl-D-alanine ligase [Ketobacter sp.]